MSADLEELEDKLLEIFNARHRYGKASNNSSSYSEAAMAAADCVDALLKVRQQRHREEGNPHLAPQNNGQRNIRRYTKKK